MKVLGEFCDVGFDIAEPVGRTQPMQPRHFQHVLGIHRRDDQFRVSAHVESGLDPDFLERQIGTIDLAFGIFDKASIGCRPDGQVFGVIGDRADAGTTGNGQGKGH